VAKQIILNTPHNQIATAARYILTGMTVDYENGRAILHLKDEHGRGFSASVASIPPTTQENAVIALVNNGVLAGTIGDV